MNEQELTAEKDAPAGPWIPVRGGFLCDPLCASGHVVIRDQVAYWQASNDAEFVLDLTDAAISEARRRNLQARVIPPGSSDPALRSAL